MTHFEPDVPKQIQNLLRHLLHIWRNFAGSVAVQQHHIDIAKGIEFAPAVSAERDQRQRSLRLTDRVGSGRKNVSQNYVDQFATTGADFPAATASLMFQTKPMFLQLEKFFVGR